jgi:hypothetical protein
MAIGSFGSDLASAAPVALEVESVVISALLHGQREWISLTD